MDKTLDMIILRLQGVKACNALQEMNESDKDGQDYQEASRAGNNLLQDAKVLLLELTDV